MPPDAEVARRLAETTLALVDIPSESRREAGAAAWVEAAVPVDAVRLVHRAEATLFYLSERRPRAALAVLAGHLDTVPAQGNLPGRIADGWVHGLGASDMKGGVAVMVELARTLAAAPTPLAVDLGLLFFPREELQQEESALPALFDACPAIREADLVVVLEPTDNELHLGCLGNLNATLVFRGESAHSARPWTGTNAIERAVAGLARVLPVPGREVEIQGLRFVEVASPTEIAAGIATNVIPDHATCVLNFRYAPDRPPAAAEEHVRELAAAARADDVRIAGNSHPAPVVRDAPLVGRLRDAGGFSFAPKQAWTPVAEFAAAGLLGVNLGPGATRYAHKRDERVEIAELVRTYEALHRFLTEPWPDG